MIHDLKKGYTLDTWGLSPASGIGTSEEGTCAKHIAKALKICGLDFHGAEFCAPSNVRSIRGGDGRGLPEPHNVVAPLTAILLEG